MTLPYPACSSDLAWTDFHLIGPLKEALHGSKFRDNDEVKKNVLNWLRFQDKDLFAAGIKILFRDGTSVLMLLGFMLERILIE